MLKNYNKDIKYIYVENMEKIKMEENKNITLWHGGRDLEFNYREPKPSQKGRWEHGPGLYLTTHYETARDYAKGGGKTYKVEFELGENIQNVMIPLEKALLFIYDNATKKKQKIIIDDIHENMKRMNLIDKVEANVFLNLLFNYDAVVGNKTLNLNRFLVESGVDYGVVNRFKGRDETVFVIYNLDKIKKVKHISAKDVDLKDFELELNFNTRNKLKM